MLTEDSLLALIDDDCGVARVDELGDVDRHGPSVIT
jgi:hypothetical protein